MAVILTVKDKDISHRLCSCTSCLIKSVAVLRATCLIFNERCIRRSGHTVQQKQGHSVLISQEAVERTRHYWLFLQKTYCPAHEKKGSPSLLQNCIHTLLQLCTKLLSSVVHWARILPSLLPCYTIQNTYCPSQGN